MAHPYDIEYFPGFTPKSQYPECQQEKQLELICAKESDQWDSNYTNLDKPSAFKPILKSSNLNGQGATNNEGYPKSSFIEV